MLSSGTLTLIIWPYRINRNLTIFKYFSSFLTCFRCPRKDKTFWNYKQKSFNSHAHNKHLIIQVNCIDVFTFHHYIKQLACWKLHSHHHYQPSLGHRRTEASKLQNVINSASWSLAHLYLLFTVYLPLSFYIFFPPPNAKTIYCKTFNNATSLFIWFT